MYNYVYSFSFAADRELTNEEIMKISHAGSDKMREIILEKTGIETMKHNSGSGVENR